MNSIKEFEKVSSLDRKRLVILYQLLRLTDFIKGDVAEVGVYKGGSAKMLAETIWPFNKNIHLFDTFCGMPKVDTTKDNHHKEGDFAGTSLDIVQKYLEYCFNTCIYPGFFPDTAKNVLGPFSFVHIDVDIYQSTLDCYEFFYPKMSYNGIIVCDDYNFASCLGAKFAVDEFFEDKPEVPICLSTRQCFVIKR